MKTLEYTPRSTTEQSTYPNELSDAERVRADIEQDFKTAEGKDVQEDFFTKSLTLSEEERQSPTREDYKKALTDDEQLPGHAWQTARKELDQPLLLTQPPEVRHPWDEEPVMSEVVDPQALAARQRFEEYTRRQEETREQVRQFAVEKPPKGLRGLLVLFKNLFEEGASRAKVPPLPVVAGRAAIVSIAMFQ